MDEKTREYLLKCREQWKKYSGHLKDIVNLNCFPRSVVFLDHLTTPIFCTNPIHQEPTQLILKQTMLGELCLACPEYQAEKCPCLLPLEKAWAALFCQEHGIAYDLISFTLVNGYLCWVQRVLIDVDWPTVQTDIVGYDVKQDGEKLQKAIEAGKQKKELSIEQKEIEKLKEKEQEIKKLHEMYEQKQKEKEQEIEQLKKELEQVQNTVKNPQVSIEQNSISSQKEEENNHNAFEQCFLRRRNAQNLTFETSWKGGFALSKSHHCEENEKNPKNSSDEALTNAHEKEMKRLNELREQELERVKEEKQKEVDLEESVSPQRKRKWEDDEEEEEASSKKKQRRDSKNEKEEKEEEEERLKLHCTPPDEIEFWKVVREHDPLMVKHKSIARKGKEQYKGHDLKCKNRSKASCTAKAKVMYTKTNGYVFKPHPKFPHTNACLQLQE